MAAYKKGSAEVARLAIIAQIGLSTDDAAPVFTVTTPRDIALVDAIEPPRPVLLQYHPVDLLLLNRSH
jgi:hypothetical protein